KKAFISSRDSLRMSCLPVAVVIMMQRYAKAQKASAVRNPDEDTRFAGPGSLRKDQRIGTETVHIVGADEQARFFVQEVNFSFTVAIQEVISFGGAPGVKQLDRFPSTVVSVEFDHTGRSRSAPANVVQKFGCRLVFVHFLLQAGIVAHELPGAYYRLCRQTEGERYKSSQYCNGTGFHGRFLIEPKLAKIHRKVAHLRMNPRPCGYFALTRCSKPRCVHRFAGSGYGTAQLTFVS